MKLAALFLVAVVAVAPPRIELQLDESLKLRSSKAYTATARVQPDGSRVMSRKDYTVVCAAGDDAAKCPLPKAKAFDSVQGEVAVNKKIYQNMQAQWLIEQMEEKKAIKEVEKQRDAAYDSQVIMANHIRGVMDTHIETTKRSNKKAESDYNLNLAVEHRERKHTKIAQEATQSALHVDKIMQDPMLNESAGGIKGMTTEQRASVYEYNLAQMQHKRNVKKAEVEEEKRHAESVEQAVAVMGSIEHHKTQLEKAQRKMMDQENSVIAQAQRNMQQTLKGTYANQVHEDYFNKFNSTAR